MIDHALIDNLNLKAEDFSIRWKNMIRKAPQLNHYNSMSDAALVATNKPLFGLLSKIMERGLDRSLVGDFFVKQGKELLKEGYPISEIIYAMSLAERVVIEYIMTEFATESQVRMYQSMGAISRIGEFFLLGCFYITKGFLEAVYTRMNVHDSVSEELLKKYFRDDFFFKQE